MIILQNGDTINFIDKEGFRQGVFIYIDTSIAGIESLEGKFINDIPSGSWRQTYADSSYCIGLYGTMVSYGLVDWYNVNKHVGGLGDRVGIWKTYSKTGRLITTEVPTTINNFYKNQKIRTIYDSANQIIYKQTKTRILFGFSIDREVECVYHQNGKIRYKKKETFNTENFKSYFINGKVDSTYHYDRRFFMRFIKIKIYFDNGQLQSIKQYKLKKRIVNDSMNSSVIVDFDEYKNSIWKIYSIDGKLITYERYKKDKLISKKTIH